MKMMIPSKSGSLWQSSGRKQDELHLIPLQNLKNHPDSSSDSSSGNTSNGKSKKKSKNTRTADKALAGVQNLEHIQRNTDAQLKNIIDGQLEIKSMFKSAQSELRAVKDSISDLYVKHDTTQNTARIIQEGIMSNTLAIKTNFEIAKEHNLLIEKRLDMLAK